MQGIRTGREACAHNVQEPRETDADGTADPPKREMLAQPPVVLVLFARHQGVWRVDPSPRR